MSKIILNASIVSRNKTYADSLLSDLSELDSEPMMLSSHKPKKEKKKKEVDELEEVSQESTDDWLRTVATFKRERITTSKRHNGSSGLFDFIDEKGGGKKKKKKHGKKNGDFTDYDKVFEPEMNILRNTLEDQLRFTSALQRRYDALENGKSAARGIGKFTTDLVGQINQARNTAMSITDKIISAKKSIADLQMKERKEKGDQLDSENMGLYSSNLLKQIMSYDRKELGMYNANSVPEEGDADTLFENLEQDLADNGVTRDDEIDKYMQYGTDVEIRAVIDKDTKEYEFEAVDTTTGSVIDDYPLPTVNRLDINMSTNVASDEYYTKYPIRWV